MLRIIFNKTDEEEVKKTNKKKKVNIRPDYVPFVKHTYDIVQCENSSLFNINHDFKFIYFFIFVYDF